MGAFDDLIPKDEPALFQGAFDDLIPQTPKNVGVGQVAARAAKSAANSAIAYTQAPVVGAVSLADKAASLLFGTRPGALTEAYGDRFVVPNLSEVEGAALKPGENAGPIGNAVMAAAPGLGKMAGDLAQGAPVGTAYRMATQVPGAVVRGVPAVVQALREGAATGIPAAARVATEKQAELTRAGVDPLTAAVPAAVSGLTTMGQFALPASAGSAAATLPARVASRGVQGAALNVPAGVVQRQIDEAMLPAQARPTMAANPYDLGTMIADAIGGALFGQMGSRGETFRAPNREALGYKPDPTLAPVEPPAPPAPPPAVKLEIVPKNAEPITQHAPDPTKAPIAPDWKLEGEPEPPAQPRPTVADQVAQDDLAAAVRQRVAAEEAFKLAQRRQEQADRSLRREGEIAPDYQGDGAAFKPGEEPTRTITLLDRERPVMVEGEGEGGTRVIWQNDDGTFTRAAVDPKRLSTVEQPVAMRRAQDFQERSSEPPRGVGVETMESERMPRRSTDRIAGDEAGGRATPYDPNVRESGDGEYIPRGENKLPAPEREPVQFEGNAPRLEVNDAGRANTDSAANARPGDAGSGGRDGGLDSQSGKAPRNADAGQGQAPAAVAGRPGPAAEVGRNPRVAEAREVPRLQVNYEKAVTQAKRVATTLRNLLAGENPDATKAASLRDQLSKRLASIADMAERLTPERLPQRERKGDSMLTAIRQAGGVTKELAKDIGLDKPDVKLRAGKIKSEDALVFALYDKGWLSHDEYLSPDAYKIATEKIGREVRGESADGRTEADLERQARAREREELEADARRYGIDTRDMTRDQVADAVNRAEQARMDEASLEEANAALREAAEAEREGTLDDLLDEVGVTEKEREDAKWRREGEAESKAAADEARVAGDRGEADQAEVRQRGPENDGRRGADDERVAGEPGDGAGRAGSGEGAGGAGGEGPPLGKAAGKSVADAGEVGKKYGDEELSRMSQQELEAAHEDAVQHNRRVEEDALRKHQPGEMPDEFPEWSRRRRDKWLEENVTEAADNEMQSRYVDEDRIAEFREKANDFDDESPQSLGRSLTRHLRGIDNPEKWKISPDGTAVRNALEYAQTRGWNTDQVTAAARERLVGLYGNDAPELFPMFFKKDVGASRSGGERRALGEAGGSASVHPDPRYRLNALPLDAAWDGVKAVVGRMFSDDSASAPLNKALRDLWDAAKDSDKGTLLARTFGTLFWSDASVVKSVAKALNSPTLDKVWRHFADMGGTEKVHGETFEQEVTARMQRNSNEVAGLMSGLSADQVKQVKALLENRRAIRPNADGAHKAAAAIAKLLDAERDWLRQQGVEIGDTKDYFPRVYLPGEIQRKAAEFKRAAEAAYREMGVDDPAKAAEDWYHAITLKGDGVPDVPFADLSSDVPTKNFTKTREIPADIAKRAGLDAFTDHDVTSVLTSYFRRTAKRGAFEARFGGTEYQVQRGGGTQWVTDPQAGEHVLAERTNAKWREMRKALEAEGHADLIGWAEGKILGMSGQANTSTAQWARDAAALARAVTVAVFLRRAVISSLTEPLQVANRTAALGATKATRNAVIMMAHGGERLARKLTGLGMSASEAERFRMAELLGTVLSKHLEGGVASMRLDGDPVLNERGSVVSRAADKISQAAMTASGLHDWTNANMVDATIIGMDFVKQMAADSGANRKLAAYELDRLGIPEADHAAFSKYAAGVKSADQLVADMKAGNKQAAQYVAAIDKFTRQVIMRPTAADKPMLAKHPVAQMAYGLQSWMYSYWYNVQKANINQIREAVQGEGYSAGDRATMALAPLLYTAAMVTMSTTLVNVMRDLVSGRKKDREREERNKKANIGGVSMETIRALSQAQMFGLADPFVNSLTSARYDKQFGSELGGPLLGRAAKAGMLNTKLLTDKNSPNTNTPERQAAEATYNLVVDPLLALASASIPMPAASAATFLSQRDELRQAWVDKVGGKKRTKAEY